MVNKNSTPDLRHALARVHPPPNARLSCIWAAESQPDGWEDVPPGVRAWWLSLAQELLSGPGWGRVVLVQDVGRRWFRMRYDVREATPERVLAAVEEQHGAPSSSGSFTLAWGAAVERGRVSCRGAAFSVGDQLGVCLYAVPTDLERLGAWVPDGWS
ncbi:hypothetical protein E5F05_06250 [Deinococcus metallilatus]|uniref:Uncharacterized protein n=1 Tax=Deinococcus metallilatus TaxID=1211322 RepID=A0AAJ5F4M3_9DEIO|nr:hypothetical protein [Deinococcus metallilatus]MBB5294544.1 hypothetical protein [Deinococcus metallilatus]QBY07589.1 hypothetical protein E5F05_06250 [Deinococcus metallilatus]RXJ14005.1 hypothetical protein ERJ73_05085 [Deinococcus metallilatus]TLK29970.1 hypothetical protein FCS05_05400 [Deinococcus metallilatus]GMA15757.1 hypothetical protein GCM10025871_20880 [Deinococcus metallilatus]